jgi:hypothetical protein
MAAAVISVSFMPAPETLRFFGSAPVQPFGGSASLAENDPEPPPNRNRL